jgi:hypothetical protein
MLETKYIKRKVERDEMPYMWWRTKENGGKK